jgi:hypothetical protein
MRWSDVMLPATPKTLRQFAGLWLVFFGLVACWQGLFLGNALRGLMSAAVGAGVGLPGLLFPGAMRPVYRLALILAFPIGWLVSHLILAAVFLMVFAPLALIFRIMGRDVLTLKQPKEKPTYWVAKPASEVNRYFYQY